MDRAKVKMLRVALENALKTVEENFNVKVNIGNGSYNDSNCSFKTEFADVSANGEVKSKEAEDFKLYATQFGLEPDDFGKTFTSNGSEFKITGLSTRKRKYPVLGTRVEDGRKFKFAVDMVKYALK